MQAPKLLEAQNTYTFQYTNDGEERWISWPTYLNLLPLLVPSRWVSYNYGQAFCQKSAYLTPTTLYTNSRWVSNYTKLCTKYNVTSCMSIACEQLATDDACTSITHAQNLFTVSKELVQVKSINSTIKFCLIFFKEIDIMSPSVCTVQWAALNATINYTPLKCHC